MSVTVDFTGRHDTGHILWLCWPIVQGGHILGSKVIVDDLHRTEKGSTRQEMDAYGTTL